MRLSPEQIAGALATRGWVEHPALPGRTNHLRAGVLVPLRWTQGRVDAVATLRPRMLRRHGGEVSFPGGRPEPVDVDLQATALREAREELGVGGYTVLGRLSSMPLWTSEWRLEPFVAVLPDVPLTPDPVEVEEVAAVDVLDVLRTGVVEGIAGSHDGTELVMPIFRPGGHVMFGATALVLWELIELCADAVGVARPELVTGPLTWDRVFAERARAGT